MKNKSNEAEFMTAPPFETQEDTWWQEGQTRIKPDEKFLQTKKGKIVLAAGAALLLSLVLLGILILRNSGQPEDELPTDTPVDSTRELTPLQQQIKDLREQLKAADPAKKDTPFPQVDLEIRVE